MQRPLFEPHILAILDSLRADPSASVVYEFLSGGLIWSDEMPTDPGLGSAVLRNGAFTYLLAYRASITLGEERAEFRPQWEQVEQNAPNWPGLRADRRDEEARRVLIKGPESL